MSNSLYGSTSHVSTKWNNVAVISGILFFDHENKEDDVAHTTYLNSLLLHFP